MSTVQADQFSRLAGLANSAGLDQRKWRWFLKELCAVTGVSKAHIYTQDRLTGVPLGYYEQGHDPAFIDSYKEHFAALNPWAKFTRHLPAGQTVRLRQLISDDVLEATEFYSDWLRPQEDMLGGGGATIECNFDRTTMIGTNIRRADRDRLEQPFIKLLDRLMPHVRQAFDVSNMLGRLSLENQVLRSGLDPSEVAIFALDSSRHVHFTNPRSDSLVSSGEIVRIDSFSKLSFVNESANSQLASALFQHSQPELNISMPFVAPGSGAMQMLCRAIPISEDDHPLPWLGHPAAPARGFTLVILVPLAARSRPLRPQTQLE